MTHMYVVPGYMVHVAFSQLHFQKLFETCACRCVVAGSISMTFMTLTNYYQVRTTR